MATAAFKSTTKRTSVVGASSTEDSSSSSLRHRRSRSLSRPSRTLSSRDEERPRGSFVNTVRGSGFPEISLDDLAIELFESADRGRFSSRSSESEATPAGGTASQRRGRSASRKGSGGVGDDRRSSIGGSSGGRTVSDANSRRRRSLSVVRCQISDSESDLDHSSKSRANLKNADFGNKLKHKPVVSDQRPTLRKSLSQKDLRSYDGYSSHSSVLTDDEGAGAHFNRSGVEKLQAAYAQKKVALPDMDRGSHKALRRELRPMETEQAVVKPRSSSSSMGDRMLSDNADVIKAISSMRRNYETELEESEKRKQDLLAEIVFEEQRGRELSQIVKELIPASKNSSTQKPSRARKRSTDRCRVSMSLTEEAEKYIEDFISNVEDTDISSLDGERSETSSSIGGLMKPEMSTSPPIPRSIPALMDGIALPWLQWETNNDASPMTSLNNTLTTSKSASSTQELTKPQDQSNYSASSRGSWSSDCLEEYVGKDVLNKVFVYPDRSSFSARSKELRYDIDDYLKVKSNEDYLIERWQQRQRINSGSLLLCHPRLF